jgi:hypothetical protein
MIDNCKVKHVVNENESNLLSAAATQRVNSDDRRPLSRGRFPFSLLLVSCFPLTCVTSTSLLAVCCATLTPPCGGGDPSSSPCSLSIRPGIRLRRFLSMPIYRKRGYCKKSSVVSVECGHMEMEYTAGCSEAALDVLVQLTLPEVFVT